MEEDGEDEEAMYLAEQGRRDDEAARLRMLAECPPELAHLVRALDHRRLGLGLGS